MICWIYGFTTTLDIGRHKSFKNNYISIFSLAFAVIYYIIYIQQLQGVLIVGTPAESMELAQITPSECQDLCQELDDCSWFMLSISTNAQTG